MSFQISFEGREGRAMMEGKRERIPGLYSRETEGLTTMLFSFEVGDAKLAISLLEECGDLEGTWIWTRSAK